MMGHRRGAVSLIGGLVLLSLAARLSCTAIGAGSSSTLLSPVLFSVRGGVYVTNLTLTLSATPTSAQIHFTTDGSIPTDKSPVYSEPIAINSCVVVRAKAYEASQSSPTASETYTLVDESLAGFNSNLPLVIVNTFGQELTRESKDLGSIRIIEPARGRTQLLGSAVLDARARLNLRGHSSLRYPKRSYRLKLLDSDDQPAKSAVFGFPKDGDWVLYAPYPDKTLMRDVLAYELSNAMGRYAPRTQFVELFVNPNAPKLSARHYLGVYVFEEKIKRGKDRVPIEKLAPEDNDEPAISGGYIFKKDHMERADVGTPNIGGFPSNGTPPASMTRPGFPTGPGGFPADPSGFLPSEGQGDSNSGMYLGAMDRLMRNGEGFLSPHRTAFLYVEPSASQITLAQRRWLNQYIRKVELALYGPDFRDPAKGYAAYLDADSFIDYHWLVEATKNIDGFRFSTFYSKDRDGKIKMGPLWDWNLSFGAANGKQGYMAEHWYWPQLDDQQYSWFRRLFEDPDFSQKYVDRWGTLRTNQFSATRILGRIDELAALLNEAQARNFKRWRILGRQVWPQYYTGKTYADEVQYLKRWTTQRLSWIDRQIVAGPTVTAEPGPAPGSRRVVLHAAVGKIFYTTDGSDPRSSGGALSPAAQSFRTAVRLNNSAVLTARVLDGKRWSWPVRFGGSPEAVSGNNAPSPP